MYFDVGYLVPGQYHKLQLFFCECGGEDLIPYLEQRSTVWRVEWTQGRGADSKHMHTGLLQPVTSNRV